MQTGEAVHVAAIPHPFLAATADMDVPEGRTVAEIIELLQPDPILRRHAYVFVDDWMVPRERWDRVRPRAGHIVTVRMVPTGGDDDGKSPLRIVLTIAVIAATIAFSAGLGTAIVGAEAFTIFGLEVASSAIGAAIISTAGGLLVNAIAPIRPPSLDSARGGPGNPVESPSYFIDQAKNALRPYSPVPVIFGRHRVVPPLGAEPYTEVIGKNQHMRMLVVWGYGPLDVDELQIGDTPVSSFEDVQIETRQGYSTDDDITIIPDDVDQENLSIHLTKTAGWVTRRTGTDADEISIDISLPKGLAAYDDEGKRTNNTVTLEVQYRRVGDTQWLSPVGTSSDIYAKAIQESNWSGKADSLTAAIVLIAKRVRRTFPSGNISNTANGQIRLRAARNQPIRHGMRWGVLTRGQYDVRVRRVSGDETSDQRFSDTYWSALRTITDRDPIAFPKPLAVTAIDIRATDQLSRAIDNLNAVVESIALDWNGSAWVSRATRNPASMFRMAVQSPARRHPAPDSEINLAALQDWHEFCTANGYHFDHIHDTSRSLWELLSDICAAGRASPSRVDGKWTVIVDTGTQPLRQHFTPVNARGFEMRRAFEPVPDGVKVTFANEDKDWKRDERIVYADGYDDTTATYLPTVNPTGITNKDHVWRFGRFHLAQAKLRRELWLLETSLEYLVAPRGSRVSCQHDAIAVGLASARVKAAVLNGSGDTTSVELDTPIQFPEAVTYGAKLRTPTNDDILATLDVTGGPGTDAEDTLTFVSAVSGAVPVGTLVSVGKVGLVTIDGLVTNVRSNNDLQAQLSVVPFQEDIYDAETGGIPAFNSKIADAPGQHVLVIQSIVADASAVRLIGDVWEPSIRVEVVGIDVIGATIDCEIRANGTDEAYLPAAVRYRSSDSIEIGDVETSLYYDVRLRWQVPDGEPGPWTAVTGHQVTGANEPPGPSNFLLDVLPDGTRRFRWMPPAIGSFAGVELRYSESQTATFDTMTAMHQGLLTADHWETVEPQRAGTYRFGIRSVDTQGLPSDPVYIVADLGPSRTGDVLYWRCPSAEGWPGTVTGATRTVDGKDALIGKPTYDWSAPATWGAWTSWAGGDGDDYATTMSYVAPVVDLEAVLTIAIQWSADTVGTVAAEYRVSQTAADPTGTWTAVNQSATVKGRKFEIRWTLTGDGSQLLFLDHLCFSLNAPAAVEHFRDVNTSGWQGSLSAGRKIPSDLAVVTDIDMVLQNVGAGWTWEIVDKSPPTIKIYDDDGASSDAVVDATVRGVLST